MLSCSCSLHSLGASTVLEVSDGGLAGGVQIQSWRQGLVIGRHSGVGWSERQNLIWIWQTVAGALGVHMLFCGWMLTPGHAVEARDKNQAGNIQVHDCRGYSQVNMVTLAMSPWKVSPQPCHLTEGRIWLCPQTAVCGRERRQGRGKAGWLYIHLWL